jgi:hypothetical protein
MAAFLPGEWKIECTSTSISTVAGRGQAGVSCENSRPNPPTRKNIMRFLLFCLACLPAVSLAQTTADKANQEKFEQRFRAADKNGDGRLSRGEAYAEFPNAPTFFNEIDADNDHHITLIEFNQAMARRVEATLAASSRGGGAKYVKPEYLRAGPSSAAGPAAGRDLASSIAQKRSNEFYELLDGAPEPDPYPDPDVAADAASNLVRKPF